MYLYIVFKIKRFSIYLYICVSHTKSEESVESPGSGITCGCEYNLFFFFYIKCFLNCMLLIFMGMLFEVI